MLFAEFALICTYLATSMLSQIKFFSGFPDAATWIWRYQSWLSWGQLQYACKHVTITSNSICGDRCADQGRETTTRYSERNISLSTNYSVISWGLKGRVGSGSVHWFRSKYPLVCTCTGCEGWTDWCLLWPMAIQPTPHSLLVALPTR